MRFSEQEYWSGLPFLSPGDFLNLGIKPGFPTLQADSLPVEPQRKPLDGKIYSRQMGSKKSGGSNPHIRQNKPQNKEYYKRYRRVLHNDQGINPRGRHNNCNYLNHSISQLSKSMPQPVTLKKLKLNSSMKTYKTF